MAEQDAKEIPMNEVLASIRNIMRDNQKPYHPAFDKNEMTSPFNRPAEKKSAQFSSATEENIENDVNAICRNINKIIQKPEQMSEKVFSLNVNANAQQQATPRQYVQPQAAKPADYSAVIINQFQKYFAERRTGDRWYCDRYASDEPHRPFEADGKINENQELLNIR